MAFLTSSVIGEQPLDRDAELAVPGHSRGQEVSGTALGLIRIHGGEGEPRVIVDGDVEELGADALDPVAAVAGDAVRRPLDAHQALDIQMQQIARSRVLKVSNQLIADSAFSIEQFLSDTLSKRYYRGVSNAVINGNGSNVSSIVAGASVGFTLPTGSTTTFTYPGLVNFYSSLDPAYIPNSYWLMNNVTWAALMNVTDTLGRPLLQNDTNGAPFRSLFGQDIRMAQALPNPAAGNSPILFGDLLKATLYVLLGRWW